MNAAPSRGFTLVELLIALVLIGLVMLLLFGGLRLSTRSWDSSEAHRQRVAEQYRVQQLLRQLISQARNLRVRGDTGEALLAFQGEPDELVFVAPGRDSDLSGTLYWYRLLMREGAQQSALVLQARRYEETESVRWNLLFAAGETDATGGEIMINEYTLVAMPSARLELSYLQQSDRYLQSQPDWLEQTVLPRLVELDLVDRSAADTVRTWAPLAVVLEEYSHVLRRP